MGEGQETLWHTHLAVKAVMLTALKSLRQKNRRYLIRSHSSTLPPMNQTEALRTGT